jgi:hypothetical protein
MLLINKVVLFLYLSHKEGIKKERERKREGKEMKEAKN